MFERFLKFFLENYKMNYTLFFLIFAIGIYSYTKIPKEISPTIEPETITIRGAYSGASVDSLNTMAVAEIESEVQNIVGVQNVSSIISPGKFAITLELEKGIDKQTILRDVEDTLTLVQDTLPSDMEVPTVRNVAHSKSLMQVSIRSSELSRDELQALAKKLKTKILTIENISDVTIFGDSDLYYEVLIDEDRLSAYDLSLDDVVKVFSELSYIFPLGKIDNAKEQFFLSIKNEEQLSKKLENTTINIGDKQLTIKDIATITKRYEDASTLASMDGKNSISLAVSQNPIGNAITISEQVKKLVNTLNIKGAVLDIRMDNSTVIKDRLNIVISNIMFGILLIMFLISILINARMAFIIALGIPTSFVIGAIYFYFTPYSINVNSLIGVLIAIGIIVDDAIVVSENIQQYIEKGYSPKEAALLGTKEMAKPVTIASITTLFSFIPLLMISGRLGEIIQLIPIAFSALVIASLIESFVFLPIHASHTLSKNSKTLSWERINTLYANSLDFLLKYQKSFITVFLIVVPVLIFFSAKNSKFQMFQPFDTSSITITFKAQPTMTLEESLAIIQELEKKILSQKERFYVKHVSSTAGYRRTATGTAEMYPYVGYINLELYKLKPMNFMDKFITPYLSFYYDDTDRIRDKSSQEISKDLRKWLQKEELKKKYNLSNLMVVEKKMGHAKADIRIGVVSDDHKKALQAVRDLESALANVEGIKYYGDNVKVGIDEIKISLNSYAQELGVTKKYIGNYIANLYLSKKIATVFDGKELLDVKIKSINFKDDLEKFKNIEVFIKNQYVKLSDLCTFEKVESLETLVKEDGETNFYVFANVDPSIVTSSEALEKIKPALEKIKNTPGVSLRFKGEQEQQRTMQIEMFFASIVAIVLIFISILYLFNSFRETLIVLSVIPFSVLGVYAGHFIMGLNLSLPSLIGALGLSGVIVNDGIIMMATLRNAQTKSDIFKLASRRLRPIVLTSVTTIVGLSSLMFFATAQAVAFQPLAISLGFGLLWGTILNLFYVPVLYNYISGVKDA
ncbi:efflux RND transporter permease subunit [Sulfurimonas sp. C5]|uniref:efflux RND transporter permease subunit n=1 Tax=Sulfurimonas sp. C5 TaxID=3036947 RepID=UPI002457D9C2|nr:efflux RND transporter permease subunit [Sulfurimonas sp. C5]MDH4944127.1 efflux RND transporter permease subunit [Sulfurimonas sp. C5]